MRKSIKQQVSDQIDLLPVTAREKVILILKGVLAVFVLDYFFYRSLWALIPLSGLGFLYYRLEADSLRERKREEVRIQFRELLLLVSTGQRAGYSVDNAFLGSYHDMRQLYGADSTICRILSILKIGRENNMSAAELWKDIAKKLQIQEIQEFAFIYQVAQSKSGNMADIMEKTAEVIVSRIETEREIALLTSARRLEQRIMNVMPFAIMLYIELTSPGYFKILYQFPQGTLLMSLSLGVYAAAYFLSVRLISIKM